MGTFFTTFIVPYFLKLKKLPILHQVLSSFIKFSGGESGKNE